MNVTIDTELVIVTLRGLLYLREALYLYVGKVSAGSNVVKGKKRLIGRRLYRKIQQLRY
jgi:hypothetical protein